MAKETKMPYQGTMSKIRHLDNLVARWLLRHFYFIFFEIVLVVIFVIWFINTIHVIDLNSEGVSSPQIEQILTNQTTQLTLIVFILLLNSFWILFIFNGLQRTITILKDISYNLNPSRPIKR